MKFLINTMVPLMRRLQAINNGQENHTMDLLG
jgi:hypothetical protein